MNLPVLTAHQVYPYFFQLGGRLSPISIRDQMVRGEALVEQAIEVGLIGRDTGRPLLVVGAGVAGATVAIAAARQKVPTLLVDHGSVPFQLQAACATRWIDPAQYDWPVDHYASSHYPWMPANPMPPLGWTGSWANHLAAGWSTLLSSAQRQYPWLWFLPGTMAVAPAAGNNPPAGGWTIDLTNGGHRWTASFAMVVWTVGFGQETHFVRPNAHSPAGYVQFAGFPFWSRDHLIQRRYGLPPKIEPNIVISGGGDGALQDFLRVMSNPTFRSASEIFTACNIPAWVLSAIHSAEERAQRAYQWGDGGRYDHMVLQTLHDLHVGLVQHVVQLPQVHSGLRTILRPDYPSVSLVHGCTHFRNCYGLNRFLVMLIAAYVEQFDGHKCPIHHGKRTVAVAGVAGHHCGGGYAQCHGQEHEVLLVDDPECWSTPAGNPADPLSANIVVIRHGIDLSALPQPQVPDVALPRQLPPYHYHR